MELIPLARSFLIKKIKLGNKDTVVQWSFMLFVSESLKCAGRHEKKFNLIFEFGVKLRTTEKQDTSN